MEQTPATLSEPQRHVLLQHENQLDAAAGITHRFVAVNGITLHLATCGVPGRPLVLFLHGFPEFWFAWEQQLQWFGSGYFAVAPDLRGFNLSDKPEGIRAHQARHVIEDLHQLVTGLGYEQCIVVGHDWGGAIAWNFASAHPQQVAALVAINAAHTAVFARALADDPAQQAASQYMLQLRRPDAEQALAADRFAWLRQMLLGSTTDDAWFDARTEARYLAAWSRPGALTGALNYYRATPVAPPSADAPGAAALQLRDEDFFVHVPTLVIWGERDRHLLPCLLDDLPRYVRALTVVRDPGSSHWIVHERPRFVHDTVTGWLGSLHP